jgi:imidazolonepropionase-like amidohydrolase
MIDVHTHLTMDPNFDPYHELSTTVAKSALIGAHNAKITLEAGITTVRNVGADGFADVDLRDAINEGLIEGPHMQVSGPPLGITGGHMDERICCRSPTMSPRKESPTASLRFNIWCAATSSMARI